MKSCPPDTHPEEIDKPKSIDAEKEKEIERGRLRKWWEKAWKETFVATSETTNRNSRAKLSDTHTHMRSAYIYIDLESRYMVIHT